MASVRFAGVTGLGFRVPSMSAAVVGLILTTFSATCKHADPCRQPRTLHHKKTAKPLNN